MNLNRVNLTCGQACFLFWSKVKFVPLLAHVLVALQHLCSTCPWSCFTLVMAVGELLDGVIILDKQSDGDGLINFVVTYPSWARWNLTYSQRQQQTPAVK